MCVCLCARAQILHVCHVICIFASIHAVLSIHFLSQISTHTNHSQSCFHTSASCVGPMNADATSAHQCINSLWKSFWISSCCAGNIGSKYGIVGIKIAIQTKQHHSLVARPSISSCLIQKTLVFSNSRFAPPAEPAAVHNKHIAVTLFHCQFALHPC